MDAPLFDLKETFEAQDYLYFYNLRLTPERTEQEVDAIWRILALQSGMTVLDLACGHGRIANALAARGCQVVGLDITPDFLELARRDAKQQGVEVDYVEGDMRSLPWTARFDAIVNWFTAYGYFEDKDNQKVLAEAYRALKPGGKLLLELNNRDRILQRYQSATVVEHDSNYMIDQMHYDVLTGRTHTERTILRDGRTRRFQFAIRLFTYPEIATWLSQAGFRQVSGFDQEGSPLTLESRRMIVVADK